MNKGVVEMEELRNVLELLQKLDPKEIDLYLRTY